MNSTLHCPSHLCRPMALSTQAIVNSARRAIATARRCPSIRSSPAATSPAALQATEAPAEKEPVDIATETVDRPPLKEKTQANQSKVSGQVVLRPIPASLLQCLVVCPNEL